MEGRRKEGARIRGFCSRDVGTSALFGVLLFNENVNMFIHTVFNGF